MIDFTRLVSEGDGVWWGQGAGEPELLVDTLLEQAPAIGPIRGFSGLTLNPRFRQELPAELELVSYGALGELRTPARDGRLRIVPCHYSAIPRLFAAGSLPSDVGLLQVSRPNQRGEVSLGVVADYLPDAISATRVLIAEVNSAMPFTDGPTLPLSAFAGTIEVDRPLRPITNRQPDAVDLAIAARVADFIDDGDTIQLGVGTLPSAVLSALRGHHDLGVHTGTLSDGILDLIEAGVVTGARKTIDAGLAVAGSAMGSTRLYDEVARHPIAFRPASYTHSLGVLASLGNLVSINSALEVDLSGQVGAERVGNRHLGAIGGQADFSHAAAVSGARSIIALRSTAGGESTIRAGLSGGPVTTHRADVDVVVTEHGAAVLTGCDDAERARRLVSIAAPEHRDLLSERHLDRQTNYTTTQEVLA